MSFRKPCHMPFRKLNPPFTLTGFTVVDFHTLEAMFLLTTTEEREAALSLFCETRDFLAKPTLPGNRS